METAPTFCAASTSLKTMASAVRFDRQPFDRTVRWRTVANVLSMGFVVRKCFNRRRLHLSVVCRSVRSSKVRSLFLERAEVKEAEDETYGPRRRSMRRLLADCGA